MHPSHWPDVLNISATDYKNEMRQCRRAGTTTSGKMPQSIVFCTYSKSSSPTWLVLTRLELDYLLWLGALLNFVISSLNYWSTDLRQREWYLMDCQLIQLQPHFLMLNGESSSSPQTFMHTHTPLPYSFLPGIIGRKQYSAYNADNNVRN